MEIDADYTDQAKALNWLCESRKVFMRRFMWRKLGFFEKFDYISPMLNVEIYYEWFLEVLWLLWKWFTVWFGEDVDRQNAGMWLSLYYQNTAKYKNT